MARSAAATIPPEASDSLPESIRWAINGWLRETEESQKEREEEGSGLNRKQKKTVAALRDLFSKLQPSEKPVHVYRGLRLDHTQTAALMARLHAAHAAGEPVMLAGFSSCTLNPAIATIYGEKGKLKGYEKKMSKGGAGNNIVFEIACRKGLNIGSMSQDDPNNEHSEDEMLLDHDTSLRIAAIRHVPFKDEATGEVVKRMVVQMVQDVSGEDEFEL